MEKIQQEYPALVVGEDEVKREYKETAWRGQTGAKPLAAFVKAMLTPAKLAQWNGENPSFQCSK